MGIVYRQEIEKNKIGSPTLKLSASVGADSFFYATTDQNGRLCDIQVYHTDQHLALYKDPLDFIGDFMAQNPALFDPFEKVQFGISNVPFKLVTAADFSEKKLDEHLKQITFLAEGDSVMSHHLPALNAHCVFALPQNLKEEIELYFDGVDYVHSLACVLNQLAQTTEWKNYPAAIHCDFSGNSVMISSWDNGYLRSFDQWPAENVLDVRYHITRLLNKSNWSDAQFLFTGSRLNEVLENDYFSKLNDQKGIKLKLADWPESVEHLISIYSVAQCGS